MFVEDIEITEVTDRTYYCSGFSVVPVLVDSDYGVEGMSESDDIVAYLERTYESAVLLDNLTRSWKS